MGHRRRARRVGAMIGRAARAERRVGAAQNGGVGARN
jgi:hypothetical protein